MTSWEMWYYFLLNVLEWMEFNTYNAIAPYLTQITPDALSGGLVIFISFFFRPFGALFFSQLERNYALKLSLQMMIIATCGIAITPIRIAPIWMLAFKSLQGFALGGNYGTSYLTVYESEEKHPLSKRWVNFKIALLQLGWVVGCGLGKVIVLLCRVCIGNWGKIFSMISNGKWNLSITASKEFLSWGWRIPFMLSCLMAMILLANRKTVHVAQKSTRVTPKLGLIICALFLSWIEFIIFYTNVFMQRHLESKGKAQLANTLLMCFQELIMIPLFLLFGFITDKLNQSLNRDMNTIILIMIIFAFIIYGQSNSPHTIAILGSVVLSMTYVCLIPKIISIIPSESRHTIGPILNLGSIVGGGVQYFAELWVKSYGNLQFFVILAILPSLLTLVFLQLREKFQ